MVPHKNPKVIKKISNLFLPNLFESSRFKTLVPLLGIRTLKTTNSYKCKNNSEIVSNNNSIEINKTARYVLHNNLQILEMLFVFFYKEKFYLDNEYFRTVRASRM